MRNVVFITDCEGPTCLDDNALDLSQFYLPHGDSFFEQISKYDDIKHLYVKDPNYSAGDTLRLILPFFRAYGVSNKGIEYFINNIKPINFIKGAIDGHRYLIDEMGIPVFEVSTSYEQFAYLVADELHVVRKNVHCTRLDLDEYFFSKKENNKITDFLYEIIDLPKINVPKNGNEGIYRLDEGTRKTFDRLEDIFWNEMSNMECGELLKKVQVMNADGKVNAVKKILEKGVGNKEDTIYIGDSITDKEAFKYVRENGGLAVSFNGNEYAIKEAQIVCIGTNASINTVIAELFKSEGRDRVMELFSSDDPSEENEKIKNLYNSFRICKDEIEVYTKTDDNESVLIRKSKAKREELREGAGRLS